MDRLSGAGTPVEEMAKLGTDLLIVSTVEEAGVSTHFGDHRLDQQDD